MLIFLIAAVISGGYEQEIRGDCQSVFTIACGDTVQEITAGIFSEPLWVEVSRDEFAVKCDSVVICIFTSQRNGASLVLYKKADSGFIFEDQFTSLFGGNGIDFFLSHPFESASGKLLFRLNWTAFPVGYYAVPGDESSFVAPPAISSFFVLSTQGDSICTEYDHREFSM